MGSYNVLDKVNSPADVKRLDAGLLPELCTDLREFLIENVSKTGGHLASNLGAVEISVALHRIFDSPTDKIMLDVGHQSYVHKILTGRKDKFDTLRSFGGISGFLRPEESEHDCFITGHASNSISAALGMARANKILGISSSVVCVIGDGALTGGMSYEALNDAGEMRDPLVVVFNDNDMSIGKSVGALSNRLAKIRLKPQYFRLKLRTKRFFGKFRCGDDIISIVSSIKSRIKKSILKESIFEIMGFKYLGPADGNDINVVCALLSEAKAMNCPVVVHLKTIKGKGYFKSEENPGQFHGVSAFDVVTGNALKESKITFSNIFGANMCAMAESDSALVAVTAAMETGTGLDPFGKRFPDRLFDVGIAEGHAVTMCAGMASRGLRPVCAIYSTFLQRGFDQMIHDVAIQKNHVVFAVDRAGLVGEDGQTHQGVFDVPYLTEIPNMTVMSPSSHRELHAALKQALYNFNSPVAIRYPRGSEGEYTADSFDDNITVIQSGNDLTVVSYGIMINEAILACHQLKKDNISLEIIKINNLTDYDFSVIENSVKKTGKLVVIEDCVERGCIGEKIATQLCSAGVKVSFFKLINFKDQFIPEGKVDILLQHYNVDAMAIINCVKEEICGGGNKAT